MSLSASQYTTKNFCAPSESRPSQRRQAELTGRDGTAGRQAPLTFILSPKGRGDLAERARARRGETARRADGGIPSSDSGIALYKTETARRADGSAGVSPSKLLARSIGISAGMCFYRGFLRTAAKTTREVPVATGARRRRVCRGRQRRLRHGQVCGASRRLAPLSAPLRSALSPAIAAARRNWTRGWRSLHWHTTGRWDQTTQFLRER